jgi:hypothetical protein
MQRSRTGGCSWRGKEAGTICCPLGRVIFVLLMRCEFREVMSADCSLPKSAEPGRLALLAFTFLAQQLED